ncbi:MAG: hypothetical protein ABEH38_09260 [Flavobacteriales bacterium]
MRKKWVFFLLVFLALAVAGRSQSLFSGNSFDPYFQSWGASTFIDVIKGPATTYKDPAGIERAYQTQGFSYLTAAYRGRLNMVEFFEDMALSSSITPAIGASFFRSGYMHFNLPMIIHLEIGANSTESARMDQFGIVGGIGYEFHAAPLIVTRNNLPFRGEKLKNTWLQPVYTLGLRYERSGKLIELSLKYGEGPGTFTGGQTFRAQTIRVMAFYFI